jgi:hypothetical protein
MTTAMKRGPNNSPQRTQVAPATHPPATRSAELESLGPAAPDANRGFGVVEIAFPRIIGLVSSAPRAVVLKCQNKEGEHEL